MLEKDLFEFSSAEVLSPCSEFKNILYYMNIPTYFRYIWQDNPTMWIYLNVFHTGRTNNDDYFRPHFYPVCYCSLTYVQTIKDENWILMWWWQRTSLVFYKQMTSNFQLLSAELQLASLGPGHLLSSLLNIDPSFIMNYSKLLQKNPNSTWNKLMTFCDTAIHSS